MGREIQAWVRILAICSASVLVACHDEPSEGDADADADADADGDIDGDADGIGGDTDGDVDDGDAPTLPLGRVFELTPDDGPPVDVPLTGLARGATTLSGETFHVHSCLRAECFDEHEQAAVANVDGDFLYDSNPGERPDPAEEVNAYYHLQRFLEQFVTLGFTGFDHEVGVIVGFGFDDDDDGVPDDFFAGATDVWGESGIVLGRWGGRSLAYDPDVYGHELTHLVTAAVNPLDLTLGTHGLNVDPGAVAEGSADYFSCAFMGDPDLGEYTAQALGAPYLISVDNDAWCPVDRVGQTHTDGQIWSGALWEIRDLLDDELVDQAHYDALAEVAFGFSLSDVTAALRARIAEVVDAEALTAVDVILEERGLTSCDPFIRLPLGAEVGREISIPTRFTEVWSEDLGEEVFLDACPTALQLVAEVTDPDGELHVEVFVPDGEEIGLDDLAVLISLGSPVTYSLVGPVLEMTADLTASATAPIILSPLSSPPLEAGDVYISLLHSGESDGAVEVIADLR